MQGVLVEAERKGSKRECQEKVVEGRKDWYRQGGRIGRGR
jgi:hypothetical protein